MPPHPAGARVGTGAFLLRADGSLVHIYFSGSLRSASDPELEQLGAVVKGRRRLGPPLTPGQVAICGAPRSLWCPLTEARFQLVPLARPIGASQGLKMFLSPKEAGSF